MESQAEKEHMDLQPEERGSTWLEQGLGVDFFSLSQLPQRQPLGPQSKQQKEMLILIFIVSGEPLNGNNVGCL